MIDNQSRVRERYYLCSKDPVSPEKVTGWNAIHRNAAFRCTMFTHGYVTLDEAQRARDEMELVFRRHVVDLERKLLQCSLSYYKARFQKELDMWKVMEGGGEYRVFIMKEVVATNTEVVD